MKANLFESVCNNICWCQFWFPYDHYTLNKVKVIYNRCFRWLVFYRRDYSYSCICEKRCKYAFPGSPQEILVLVQQTRMFYLYDGGQHYVGMKTVRAQSKPTTSGVKYCTANKLACHCNTDTASIFVYGPCSCLKSPQRSRPRMNSPSHAGEEKPAKQEQAPGAVQPP